MSTFSDVLAKAKALNNPVVTDKANEAEAVDASRGLYAVAAQGNMKLASDNFAKYVKGEISYQALSVSLGQFNQALQMVSQAEQAITSIKADLTTAVYNDMAAAVSK